MTTADRVDPVGYRTWTPTVVAEDDYVGRHRRPGGKGFSLHRMFYSARHLDRRR